MLKIRPNVDLKELKKFGFEYFKNGCGTTGYCIRQSKGFCNIIEEDKEFNGKYNRLIPNTIDMELLYDLIQSGLVIEE